MTTYRRIEFVRTGWGSRILGIFAVALGLAVVAAILLLSLGLALVLLPIVALAVLVGRWRWRKLMAEAERRGRDSGRQGPVIELDYEVLDKGDDGRPGSDRR